MAGKSWIALWTVLVRGMLVSGAHPARQCSHKQGINLSSG